jgi:hypothetical protein
VTLIRLTATLFILVLIALSAMGWVWNGAHQASGQAAAAGRLVLTLGALAGVVGLIALWRWPRRT